jgi:hypothetical protein
MTNLGILHYFLGLQVLSMSGGFFISQYMDILTNFKMAYCKPCGTPFQSGFKLRKKFQTFKVDATLYQQLVSNPYLSFSRST